MWKFTATVTQPDDAPPGERDEILGGWLKQAENNYQRLMDLLTAVHRYPIPAPRGSHESMLEYDRRRSLKDMLLDNIISVCIDTADSLRMIRAAMQQPAEIAVGEKWEEPVHQVLAGGASRRRGRRAERLAAAVGRACGRSRCSTCRWPAAEIRSASSAPGRCTRCCAGCWPICRGWDMIFETAKLLETLQIMEIEHSLGPGSITEFDRIFAIGCKSIAHALADGVGRLGRGEKIRPAALRRSGTDRPARTNRRNPAALLAQPQPRRAALGHGNRQRRISLGRSAAVHREVRAGDFHPAVHELGKPPRHSARRRGSLARGRRGTGAKRKAPIRFFDDLDGTLDRETAVLMLTLIIEAVIENYGEYIDYNSITTQSDRGDMLYTLLDFLRLRANYDRVAWNLRPVLLIHEVLVRDGKDRGGRKLAGGRRRAHRRRRRELPPRVSEIVQEIRHAAAEHRRAAGRAIHEAAAGRSTGRARQAGDGGNSREPPAENVPASWKSSSMNSRSKIDGAGYETPEWLAAMEDEAAQVQAPIIEEDNPDPYLTLPEVRLTLDEAQEAD